MRRDMATNYISYAELSTILAALRFFESKRGGFDHPEWMEHFEDVEPLDNDAIDGLCERLNCGQIVRIEGGPKG